jgi:hypothetical protein
MEQNQPTKIIYQKGNIEIVTVDAHIKKHLKVTADKNYINISSSQNLFFEKMKLDIDALLEVNYNNSFFMQKDFKIESMLCGYLSFRIKHNNKDRIIELYSKQTEKPIKYYYDKLSGSEITIEDLIAIQQILLKRNYDVNILLKDFDSFQDYLSKKNEENLSVKDKTDIAIFESSLMLVLGNFNMPDKELQAN